MDTVGPDRIVEKSAKSPGQPHSLFAQSFLSVRWQWRMFRDLLTRVPVTTAVAVTALIVARISRMLAFFIPIKLVLLLGSDGIPTYLQSFISVQVLDVWVASLGTLVFVLYALSVSLVPVANRATVKGAKLLRPAEEGSAKSKKDRQHRLIRARKLYFQLCAQAANYLIFLLCFLVIVLLSPAIGLIFCVFMLVQCLVLDGVINRSLGTLWNLRARMSRNPRQVVECLEALNFLTVFSGIAADFLFFDGMDVTAAILILVVARRAFQSLAGVTRQTIQWSRMRANAWDVLKA